MKRKKIAIVGAGSAACTTALHYYLYGKDIFDKITIYYDPSTPIERVGQGSTLLFVSHDPTLASQFSKACDMTDINLESSQ